MTAETDAQSANRKKRVRMLKRLILISLVLAILLPILLCIVLFVRMHGLEKQLSTLQGTVAELAQLQAESLSEKSPDALSAESVQEEQPDADTTQQEVENITDTEAMTGDTEPSEPVRKVYLTFDDGPSENTADILDILAAYDVKATFFVNGKEGEWAEEAYQRIVDEGHTMGMHSYTHRYEEIYASTDAFLADMHRLQDYLYNVTGVKTMYYRFPGGSSNSVDGVGIRKLIQCLQEEGVVYYDWNISSQDATGVRYTSEELVENCMGSIEKYETVIILLHDAAGKDTTVEALPMLIERIQSMDYTELLPITDETVPVQHIKITQEETEE